VCIDFFKGPLARGGLQVDTLQVNDESKVGAKIQRSDDILVNEEMKMGVEEWQRYTGMCITALKTQTAYPGAIAFHGRPRCRAASVAPEPYAQRIVKWQEVRAPLCLLILLYLRRVGFR